VADAAAQQREELLGDVRLKRPLLVLAVMLSDLAMC